MKALEAALATVDPHAAAALRSRFSQEPRLLQALLATEGQVNTVLLRWVAFDAILMFREEVCVCVCVFMKLHITAHSDPKEGSMLCVCVCMYVYLGCPLSDAYSYTF